MPLIPESVMPHVRRFGLSGAFALGIVVVMLLGINPVTVLTGKMSPPPPPTSTTGVPPAGASPEVVAAYPPIVGGEAELMWRRAFRIAVIPFPAIGMNVVDSSVQFGCGMAGKDLGVFYCPDDRTVYVDIGAYDRLRQRFPEGADQAMALLVAQSYGHHIQNALGVFADLAAARSGRSAADVAAFEKRIDMQAACYAAMWASTARIEALLDSAAVVAALDAVEANRGRAILPDRPGAPIPETLTSASFSSRKVWYDRGYAIPAGGTCALTRIEAEGLM